jgi:hypothetical protein
MPRGSKPGERRGGRRRATPNKRTVLTDRILAAASCNPTATRHELLLILAKDQAVPADIRIVIARKSFPAVTSRSVESGTQKAFASLVPIPQSVEDASNAKLDRGRLGAKMGPKAFPALGLLLSIVQDTTALPAQRRKAASEVSGYFLPEYSDGRKLRRRKFPPDECGFVVDPDLARELRDSKLRLASLPLAKKITPYTVAQRASKIQTRIRAIQQSLQCPCPSKYGRNDVERDRVRLESFSLKRRSQRILTLDEDLEEARRMARYDSYLHGPESSARRRLADLRERRAVLTLAEKATLRCLELLYPPPPPPPSGPDALTRAEHPFHDLPISEDEPSPPTSPDLPISQASKASTSEARQEPSQAT